METIQFEPQTSPRNLSFSSHADISASGISRSNLSGQNLDSSSSADHNQPRSLHELLTGSTLTSTVEKNRSNTPASDQIAGSSNLPISDKTPTVSRALQELMLSEDKMSHASSLCLLYLHLLHLPEL
uniref:Uncharacterized protein n=1 Tax=Arundo donax TaxID=35708 RepID=A0A0A9ENJ7_ARUDO